MIQVSSAVTEMRISIFFWFAVLATVGCDASFTNLAETEIVSKNNGMTNQNNGTTSSTNNDTNNSIIESSVSGEFMEVDYAGSGNATVVRFANGSYELRLTDLEFRGVPGPVLVMTTRDSLDGGIDETKGDRLIADSIQNTDSATFALDFDASAYGHVWIYCLPFQLEVILAELAPSN